MSSAWPPNLLLANIRDKEYMNSTLGSIVPRKDVPSLSHGRTTRFDICRRSESRLPFDVFPFSPCVMDRKVEKMFAVYQTDKSMTTQTSMPSRKTPDYPWASAVL
jgi:hypothetical protein